MDVLLETCLSHERSGKYMTLSTEKEHEGTGISVFFLHIAILRKTSKHTSIFSNN